MAYLYKDIMKIPGLSGSSFDRQKQYYNKLGSPMGNYTGSLKQNTYLLGQLGKNNYGLPSTNSRPATRTTTSKSISKPVARTSPTKNIIDKYVNMVTPRGGVQTPTSFSEIMPYETLVNRDLINQFAYSQVDPEINRIRDRQMQDLAVQQGRRGTHRFGMAQTQRQDVLDAISRQREEMAQPFSQMGQDYLSNYYNELESEYYKDPQAFQYTPLNPNKLLSNYYGS